jgi:branched-chain amino acid aminotransferase
VSIPLSQRTDMVVYMNGAFVPANEARVGVMSHALSYGTGCFEGIRGYWNDQTQELYIFRLREHYERLHRSCRIVNIELPYTVDELIAITVDLVRRNNLRENCYIRPFAYKADEIIGVRLNNLEDAFLVYAVPMGDYVATTGLRCGVSSWRRVDDNMIPARAKISGAYMNSAFAKTEALMNGFDEAVMLTSEGHVSEGSAENIFMLINGELVTPSASENILLGITRDTVMQLARRELDRITRERQIDRTELYIADEIFLTGTGAQLAPVIEVDHRPVGTGKVGPLTETFQRTYYEVVRGMRPEYLDWLTPVYAKSGTVARGKVASNGHNSHSNHTSPANGHAKPRSASKTRTR